MAGVAGDHLTPAEVVVVDLLHHRDHPARRPLSRVVGSEAVPVPVIGGVAVLARHAERRGEEPHCRHELIDRNAFEHQDVFEDLIRHGRLLGRRLRAHKRGAQQAGEECRGRQKRRLARSERHAMSPRVRSKKWAARCGPSFLPGVESVTSLARPAGRSSPSGRFPCRNRSA